MLFVKQDATGIKFPAEENNTTRNINKDRLKKTVKYLSNKMVSLYFIRYEKFTLSIKTFNSYFLIQEKTPKL